MDTYTDLQRLLTDCEQMVRWTDSCTDGRTDRCALGQYGQINRWTDSQTDDKVNKEIVF